ncbi:MAG: hypothetical protein N2C14_24155 [Planctomycetales bacterium]
MMKSFFQAMCLVAGTTLFAAVSLHAQDAGDANQKLQLVNAKITAARRMIALKKNDDAAKTYSEAQAIVAELKSGNASLSVKRALSRYERSLTSVGKQLERLGVKIPAAAPKDSPTPAGAPAPAGGDQVSFMKTIAPMLARKCGGCHMKATNPAGKLSMRTFANLMRGKEGSAVITPRNGKGSHIVEVIAAGDMPPRGAKPTAAELASLTTWIDQGAKFDGPSQTAVLNQGGGNRNGPSLALAKATGNEKISFSRDIAPILAANCMLCHGADNPSNDRAFDTFARILTPGDSGPAFMPGKAAASLILGKLKGTADGPRMPLRKPPLSSDLIAKIETWIAEGAKFDGPDPKMNTKRVGDIYMAEHMTHEELAAERLKYATKNWNLANPEEKQAKVETEHFLVLGNVIKSRLEEIAESAEKKHEEVGKIFKAPADKPLLKGKLTIFVFERSYQYAEYGTMVEKRTLPRSWRGHWSYDIVDAYACIAPPRPGTDTVDRLLTELLAGAYLESLGEDPSWFSQGISRAVSARTDVKNPAVVKWNAKLPEVLGTFDPATLVEGTMNLDAASITAYGFGKGLLSKRTQYESLLTALKKGDDFDAAFRKAFRTDPKTYISGWARSGGRRR